MYIDDCDATSIGLGASMIGSSAVLAELRADPGPLRIAEIAERLGAHPNTVRFHLATLIERGQVERVELPPAGPGRPAQLFRVVQGMDRTGPRHYQMLAEILLSELMANAGERATDRATLAGRAWGERMAEAEVSATSSQPDSVTGAEAADSAGTDPQLPVTELRLVELMTELGFAPQPSPTGDQIDLRHCPFLELVDPPQSLINVVADAPSEPEAVERSVADRLRRRDGTARMICAVHLGLLQGVLDGWRAPIAAARLEPFAEPDRCRLHLTARSI